MWSIGVSFAAKLNGKIGRPEFWKENPGEELGGSIASVKSGKISVATVKKSATNKYTITGKKKGAAVITLKLKSGKKATCTALVK